MSNNTHQNNSNESPEMQLQLQNNGRSDQQIRIKSKKTTIGSHEDCTVVLNSSSVQPVHCMLIQGSAGTVIRNFHADTRVNGESVGDAWFQTGDSVSVGDIDFQCTGSNNDSRPESEIVPRPESVQSTRELEERTQQVMDLIDRLSGLENELDQLKESSSKLDEKASAFEQQVNEKLNEVDRLEQQNADLMSRLEFTRQDREMIQELEQKSDEIASRTVELESALEQKDAIIAQFATQNSSLAQEVSDLRNRESIDLEQTEGEVEDVAVKDVAVEDVAVEDVDNDDVESSLSDETTIEDVFQQFDIADESDSGCEDEIEAESPDLAESTFDVESETEDSVDTVDSDENSQELRQEEFEQPESTDNCDQNEECDTVNDEFQNPFDSLNESESDGSAEAVDSGQFDTPASGEPVGNPFAVLDMIDQARSNSFQQIDADASESIEENDFSDSSETENAKSEITDFNDLLKSDSHESDVVNEQSEDENASDELTAQWETEFRKEFLGDDEAANHTDNESTDVIDVEELDEAESCDGSIENPTETESTFDPDAEDVDANVEQEASSELATDEIDDPCLAEEQQEQDESCSFDSEASEDEFQPLTDPFAEIRQESADIEDEHTNVDVPAEATLDNTIDSEEIAEKDDSALESEFGESESDVDEFQPLTDPYESSNQCDNETIEQESSDDNTNLESTESTSDELDFDFALAESNLAGAFAELAELEDSDAINEIEESTESELDYTESTEESSEEDSEFSDEQTESFFEAVNEAENTNPYANFIDENDEPVGDHGSFGAEIDNTTVGTGELSATDELLSSFEQVAGETFSEIFSKSHENAENLNHDFSEDQEVDEDSATAEEESAEITPEEEVEEADEALAEQSTEGLSNAEQPVPNQSGDSEDSYIQEYMKKLLGNGDEPEPTMPVTPKETEEDAPSLLEKTFEREIKERQELLKPSEFVPKSAAPEKNSNLQAMRELANESARSAIEKSTRKKKFEQQSTIVLIAAGISFFIAAVLAMLTKSMFSLYSFGSVIFFAITGAGAWYFFELQKNSTAETGNESNSNEPSAPKDELTPLDGPVGEEKDDQTNASN